MKKLFAILAVLFVVGYIFSKPAKFHSAGSCTTNSRGELSCDHSTTFGSTTTRTRMDCRKVYGTDETKCELVSD